MQELGFSGRVALQLELLPPKPKPKAKPAAVTAPPENKLPHTFDLQASVACWPRGIPVWAAAAGERTGASTRQLRARRRC